MRKKYSPILELLSGILTVVLGFLFIFRYQAIWYLVPALFTISVGLYAVSRLFKFQKGEKEKNTIIIISFIAMIGIMLYIIARPERFVSFFPLFFGLYALIQGLILLINYFVYRNDKLKHRVVILIEAIITLLFAVYLIGDPLSHIFSMSYVIGGFLLFNGFTNAIKALRKLLFKSDALFALPIPVVLAALLPRRTLKSIETMENDDPVDHKDDLEVFIYLKDSGFEQFGHMDLSYNGIIYSYGCHDPHGRVMMGAIGDGVLIKADRDKFIEHGVNYKKTTIVKYGLTLNETQKELVESRLKELTSRTVRFRSDSELATVNNTEEPEVWYLSDLYKSTGAKSYKFLKGKFRTYFVFTTNCVNVCDYVLRMKNLELLNIRGILTPGTYLDFLNDEYIRGSSIVTNRYVFHPKK